MEEYEKKKEKRIYNNNPTLLNDYFWLILQVLLSNINLIIKNAKNIIDV